MAVKPEAIIYTDGSCLGNPGPGGWASIVIVNGIEQEMSGGDADTTNNRMELLGVINGLKSLRGPHLVTIYSDSRYITDAFNKNWLKSWKRNGWARRDGELKNVELWRELDSLTQKHLCTFVWLKGHAGNRYNERCDRLAVSQSKKHGNGNRGDAESSYEKKKPAVTASDVIGALEGYIRRSNKESVGIEFPCGSLPFCDYCESTGDGRLCAWAFMEYWMREQGKEPV